MTTFWSTWICVLTLGSLIGLTWLLIGTRKGETKGSVEAVAHGLVDAALGLAIAVPD